MRCMLSEYIVVFVALFKNVCSNPLYSRIVGGQLSNITEFPFLISLQDKGGHLCGGSIIDDQFILTAAHCIIGKSVSSLFIRAGSTFAYKEGYVHEICSEITHRNYDENAFNDDVAVLKLCNPLVFGPGIFPIELPKASDQIREGTVGTVCGWGAVKEYGAASERLQKTIVKTSNQATCRKRYKNMSKVTNKMVCAVCQKGVCDACSGDSGGPLFANGKLIGIVSWGDGCAKENSPGVYTRVHKYVKWIKNATNFVF